MKRVIALIIVLALATLAGVALHSGNGYALFRYGDTSVEMSLVTAVGFDIVAFILLYGFVRLVLRLVRLRRGLGEARRRKRHAAADARPRDRERTVAPGTHMSGTKGPEKSPP